MNYNEQYYILFNDYKNNPSYLRALMKTSVRNFEYEKLHRSGGPAFFENAFDEEDKKVGEKHPINDVMDVAGWYLFSHRIYEKMRDFEIKNMQFFPAVFIDDDGHYHENYVLTNFYDELDCLDIDLSVIKYWPEEDEDEDEVEYDVKKLYLSEKVLDTIAEEQRLMFKITKTIDPYVIVHQKIKDIIDQENATGAMFIRIDQYNSGDEYHG